MAHQRTVQLLSPQYTLYDVHGIEWWGYDFYSLRAQRGAFKAVAGIKSKRLVHMDCRHLVVNVSLHDLSRTELSGYASAKVSKEYQADFRLRWRPQRQNRFTQKERDACKHGYTGRGMLGTM